MATHELGWSTFNEEHISDMEWHYAEFCTSFIIENTHNGSEKGSLKRRFHLLDLWSLDAFLSARIRWFILTHFVPTFWIFFYNITLNISIGMFNEGRWTTDHAEANDVIGLGESDV